MKLTNYFAVILLVLSSSDVSISLTTLGHVTGESHPMLASVFNVANEIRRQQSQAGEVQLSTSSGQKSIGIAKAKPIVNRGDISGSNGAFNPVEVPVIDTLPVNKGAVSFVRSGVIPTSNTNPGNGALDVLTRSSIADLTLNRGFSRETMRIGVITADMWCSLCKKTGDKECIVRYCSNDVTSNIISGVNQPPLLNNGLVSEPVQPAPSMGSPLAENIPVLDNNFAFGSQIDRHDMLHQASINTLPKQKVNDMVGLNQPTQKITRPTTETTAPIWLIADSVLSSASGRHENAVPHMIDSSDLVPPTVTKTMLPIDITREQINPVNIPAPGENIAKQIGNPDITFIDGHFGNLVPMRNPHVAAAGKSVKTQGSTPSLSKHNINAHPLDIPTDIFIQMIRSDIPTFFKSLDKLQHSSFAKPSHTVNTNIEKTLSTRTPIIPAASDVFAKSQPDNTFGFPTGFVEDAVVRHQNDVTTTTRIPHIPRAVDVFPIVESDKNAVNKQTLVLKDHGNAEKVAIHLGHGHIPDNGISLLETRGQSSEATSSNAPTLDLHSLLHLSNNQPSQPSMDVKTTTDHTSLALDHKHLTEHVGQNGNHHQNTHVVDTNAMDSQRALENAGQRANHQHSPMVGTNTMHPASILQHDIVALNGIHINGGLTEELSTTTPIPTMDPMRKAALDKFSEHLLSGIHV